MMLKEPKVSTFDLVSCLSDAIDLINPSIVDHHKQVAYIAHAIGGELGLSRDERFELALAGALHDVGAVSFNDRLGGLQFELDDPHGHAELGYLLLKMFCPFRRVSEIIRFHHVSWKGGQGAEFKGRQVPFRSHLVHLADRVAVLINKQQETFGQISEICRLIKQKSGSMFNPEVVEAFLSLAEKEYFWLDCFSPSLGTTLRNRMKHETVQLGIADITDFANLFRRVIDFRSRFTATHTSGVAASADVLARLFGFSDNERDMVRIAAYLHDLGKLAVPQEILEKPGRLTEQEFNIIRGHTFYTYRILEHIEDFSTISEWAAFHHERLDGKGYPFHLGDKQLSVGSRLIAVADVFTALREDRPYRMGMSGRETLTILKDMVKTSALDTSLVSLLERNYDVINSAREAAQQSSYQEYDEFISDQS